MNTWTAVDIFLWIAIAAPYFLGALALLALALIARRVYRALVAASHRVWMHLQESPVAEADPLDDDVDQHDYADDFSDLEPPVDTAIGTDIPDGYDDVEGLTEMRRLARLVDTAPQAPELPRPQDATHQALEALYSQPARPARTEENQ